MPDTNRVVSSLKQVENLIYFGLHDNETSYLADIVIPAKTFLEKADIRLCYGHHYIEEMHQVLQSDIGISEYDFVAAMFDRLALGGLQSEQAYLDIWRSQFATANAYAVLPDYEEIPYVEGFGKGGAEAFAFIEAYDDEYEDEEGYWLLSPMSSKSLNTQFVRSELVLLPANSGYKTGERVRICSAYGEQQFDVKLSSDLREDCVVIYSGSIGLNKLTPPLVSNEGEGACYQEVKVTIERL
jgi:anaerobic selenocysteine-containing dehydrogenase